jgi:hypothetical protein
MQIFPVVALGNSTNTLDCKANYQPNGPGTDLQSMKLEIIEQSNDETVFKATIEEFQFKVIWQRPLTTLYMTIHEGQNKLAFSTSRIPTHDHNDSMVDIRHREKIRLYLTCDFIELRP